MSSINSDKIVERIKERIQIKGHSNKIKKHNVNKIENSRKIESVKIKNTVEKYVFQEGERFECKIKTHENNLKGLKLIFKQIKKNSPFNKQITNKLVLNSKKIDEDVFLFKTDSLYLDASIYNIQILDKTNKKILENLHLKVTEGKKEIPNNIVFVEKNNKNSYFPNGHFLLIKPKLENIPSKPITITLNRLILEDIDSANLFLDGSFEKTVKNEEKWFLLHNKID